MNEKLSPKVVIGNMQVWRNHDKLIDNLVPFPCNPNIHPQQQNAGMGAERRCQKRGIYGQG